MQKNNNISLLVAFVMANTWRSYHRQEATFTGLVCVSPPIIPTLRRLKQEDLEFQVNLGYGVDPLQKG
jgi:hypothetical protein